MCISNFTPVIDPGMLPIPRATTTLPRTVPFFKCRRLAGILVKKLKSASEPTATIAGTRRPKISTGSRRTPPPTPLSPMRIPTTKPTAILAASNSMIYSLPPRPRLLSRGSVYSDEALAFQMQNDFLRGFLGRKFPGVDRHFGIGGSFIGIGDPSELLEDAGAGLGVQALAVTLLADFDRSRDVHQDEASVGLDHLANVFAGSVVGR